MLELDLENVLLSLGCRKAGAGVVSFGSYFFAKLSFLPAAVVEPTCAVVDMGSCGLGGKSFVATMLRFF